VPLLAPDAYRAAIRDEADALVAAAERAGVDASVPSCPDWDVGALLGHMGRVHRWAATCVEATEPVSPAGLPKPPSGDQLPAWVRAGAARLVEVLDRPASDPAWTWAPDRTVGFWQRRQAHETAIHRVDAELAAGPPTPVPAALAADGIDEWLALLAFRPGAEPPSGDGETLHLHCTDEAGEWLVTLTEAGPAIERRHAKGDVAVRGPASDLLLVLLRRFEPERVEVLGTRSVLDGFLAHAAF
jgi:uncharacterized protein (TIGR03083 family)